MKQKHHSAYITVWVFVLMTVLFSVQPVICQIRVIAEDDQGVTVEYYPELLQPINADQNMVRLSLKGGDNVFIPGEPELPVYIVTIAVPPGSNPTVRLLSRETGDIQEGSLSIFEPKDTENFKSLELQPPATGEVIGVSEVRSLGGLKVIRIPIYPARHSTNPPTVELAQRVVFRVEFGRYSIVQAVRPVKVNRTVQSIVVNVDQAVKWGNYITSNFTGQMWTPERNSSYRFEIREEGIYRVRFEDLMNRGIELPPNGVPSSHIQIYGNGGMDLPLDPSEEAPLGNRECAIYMNDGEDGTFGPGDWFLFYGKGAGGWVQDQQLGYRYNVNHYSPINYYWLNVNPATGGLRMETFTDELTPDTTVNTAICRYYNEAEQFIHYPGGFTGSGLEWFGYTFDGASNIYYTVNLDNPDVTLPANLRVRIIKTLREPRISIRLNGETIDEYRPGGSSFTSGHLVSDIQSSLNNRTNSITLEQLNEEARALFDWLELSYYTTLNHPCVFEEIDYNGSVKYEITNIDEPWIFNITDVNDVKFERSISFINQQQAIRQRYIVSSEVDFLTVAAPFEEYVEPARDISNLWSNRNLVDVLLITPDNYWDEIEPLLAYYASREPALAPARVRLSEIYNHFSGGLRDPAAIRNLLMYANENWANPVNYVLLCGDGDYNYRDINRAASDNFMPPYELNGLCTDDWFTDFTSYAQDQNSYPLPEVPVGRLTAANSYEMQTIVDKISAYGLEPEFGSWRSRVTLVADDEFGDSWNKEDEHVRYTEQISANCIPGYFNRDKIYLTEYERQWGREKPAAGDDLLSSINNGTLLVNFMGHGNPTLWAHEHVFVLSRDIGRIEPSRRLPVYLAFTCDWAYWDDPTAQSFPEQLLALPNRGAIGAIASTRLTGGGANYNLASNFFTNLFSEPNGSSLGEALMLAKHQYRRSPINSASYHLLGDPAMQIGAPRLRGRFTSLSSPLTPLALSAVTGQILVNNSNQFDTTFTGEVEFNVFDTKVLHYHGVYDERNDSYIDLYYHLSGQPVYRGLFSITSGIFDGQFVVPRDVTLGGELGRVLAYFYNDEVDGVIVRDSIQYDEQVAQSVDNEPPDITIYFGSRAYRESDLIGTEPLLIVDLQDSSGLNLTGALGHGINISIDGGQPIDLTPFFRYDLDSHQSGGLERKIGPISPGLHYIELQAWDNFNNFAVAELEVEVSADAGGLKLERIYNWPNPFNDKTEFTFIITDFPADYEIKIFTVGGRQIWDYNGTATTNYVRDAVWNGRDSHGRLVGNGVYLYKVTAWDDEGNRTEGIGRIAVAR
ncbi:MAG: type IX secretion system sortase PorU [Candidatus Hatepunaea meridiana]|nr:type IX secretion system sortase PorU [Candidatus Hatepunaea meridiana]